MDTNDAAQIPSSTDIGLGLKLAVRVQILPKVGTYGSGFTGTQLLVRKKILGMGVFGGLCISA